MHETFVVWMGIYGSRMDPIGKEMNQMSQNQESKSYNQLNQNSKQQKNKQQISGKASTIGAAGNINNGGKAGT